jgi:hypothetical protein
LLACERFYGLELLAGVTARQRPMNTLGKEWESNNGLSDYIALAKQVGLLEVKPRPARYSSRSLEDLLKNIGLCSVLAAGILI